MREQLPSIHKSHAVDKSATRSGSLLGRGLNAIQNKKLTPEEEQKLLSALTRLIDAAIGLGYVNFKENAIFVMNGIRDRFGNEKADLIKLNHLRGAYIATSPDGDLALNEVSKFNSLDDLLTPEQQNQKESE